MKIEFIDINGMHFASLSNEDNRYCELSDNDYKQIERWKLGGNKKIYLKLTDNNLEYSTLLGAQIFHLIKVFEKKGFSVNIDSIPNQIKEMLHSFPH